MKVAVTFHKKVPVPGVDYASQGYHLTIESEPPPEIQEDRERLRKYLAALFQECRDRVESELAAGGTDRLPSAPVSNGRRQSSRRQHQGNGRPERNGHSQNGASSAATPKQLSFARSLGSAAGLSYEDLGDMAFEAFGVEDIRSLSRRQASRLIDDLRHDDRS